jgi:hypothetical protein
VGLPGRRMAARGRSLQGCFSAGRGLQRRDPLLRFLGPAPLGGAFQGRVVAAVSAAVSRVALFGTADFTAALTWPSALLPIVSGLRRQSARAPRG